MANEDTEDLEWEEWNPTQITFVNHMIAGSVAGLAEHVSLFPIDTIKTHIQCERCGSVSPLQTWNCATKIVNNEGIFRLWRGVSAMFAGCIPAHAAYFSVFESSKVILGADKEGHHPAKAAICGSLAALSHDMFMTPFDLVKQRMQLGFYKNVADCVQTIVRAEGVRALYVSMPTTLMMNIPYGFVMVPVNESARKLLNPSDKYNVSASMAAGCIAGGVAGAVTNPLDVIKTRLQTQNLQPCPSSIKVTSNMSLAPTVSTSLSDSNFISSARGNSASFLSGDLLRRPFDGMVAVTRRIVAEEGYRGFLRGLVPRVMVQAPAVAISWTVYEGMKALFSGEGNGNIAVSK